MPSNFMPSDSSNHKIVGDDPADFDLSELPVELEELAQQLICDATFLGAKLECQELHRRDNGCENEQSDKISQEPSAHQGGMSAGMEMALESDLDPSGFDFLPKKVFEQQRREDKKKWWRFAGTVLCGMFVLGLGIQTARVIDQQMQDDGHGHVSENGSVNPNILDGATGPIVSVGGTSGNLITAPAENTIDMVPAHLSNSSDAELEGHLDVHDESRIKPLNF